MPRAKVQPEDGRPAIRPQLRSTVEGLVAVRIDGTTYCVRPETLEAFKAQLKRPR